MTAGAPAGCGANTGFFRRAIFATAWWRFRRMNTCSANYFNIVFRRAPAWAATASAIFF